MKRFALLGALLAGGVLAPAQTVTSSLIGSLVDPGGAVIAAAPLTLTESATGSARKATTDSTGVFRFPNLSPGTYSLEVKVTGFKALNESSIEVAANETRDLGRLILQLGNVTDTISVTAEATTVQLSSSEKSTEIDGNQLNDITLKGRDLFGYMKLVPGVIDTTASRDVTSPNAIGGITINGNTGGKINFTVDGITDMDTGSNGTLHYEPNLDAVQEMKILSSNYQAEFGRNSGGTITVVTKSGSRDFHGTAQWNHRHEEFNANSWLNDHSLQSNGLAQPVPRYRFNIETYTIGGPAFIPKLLNKDRRKLFFFWSQEYTGQFVSGGTQTKYTPTALERVGDFSQSFANNGTLLTITDPQNNNAPFPGNKIPSSHADPTGVGPAMLAFFPLPNFTGTGNQANVVNYFEAASATHPRRNDVLRIDPYITSKINGYFRWINDHDDMIALYQGVQFTSDVGGKLGQTGAAPIDHPNPGHGYSGSVVYAITPTLINEFTMGESWNTWSYYTTDNGTSEARSLIPNIPGLFPLPTTAPTGASPTNGYFNILPQFQFGGTPSNAMSYTRSGTSAGNYENFNPIWTFADNVSKVVGKHSLKAGFYLEHNIKVQPSTPAYAGSFNFTVDSNNPLNSGNGYANAYLGYVDSYQQATARAVFQTLYWNFEFYAQDNWRVNKRLTLDFGVRFYHQPPQSDINGTYSNFFPSMYSASGAPRLYTPGLSNGKRVAIDPGTGAVAPVAYIGLYVPNSGNPADGFSLLGKNNTSPNAYSISYLKPAPRVGFAYDLFGDGKTAIRGGFGTFYNRLDGNQVYNLSGQPPYAYTPQVNYTTTTSIAASGGSLIFGPNTYYYWPTTNVPWNGAYNASFEIQHSFAGFVGTLGYIGDWSFNQNLTYDANWLPLGARFAASAADATNGNKPLPDVLLRTKFPGYNTLNTYAEIGSTNYNAATATLQRRLTHGLGFGLSYTYSKNLGVTSYNPAVADNHAYNYGVQGPDRRHNLQINYNYQVPSVDKYLGKVGGLFLDHWTYSGVMSSTSGGPFNPGFSFSSGSTPDYTGTPTIGARINVVGNPTANVPAGSYFNPAAFALPALGTSSPAVPTYGNLGGGAGVLNYPHYTNFDMTLSKFIPIGLGERRGLKLQVQAYNVFNHTEVNAMNTGIQFNATTGAVTNAASVFTPTGTLPNRILAFSLRFEY
jgi:hypothetical protein